MRSSNLRVLMDEIFARACFMVTVTLKSINNSNNDSKQFSLDHNYVFFIPTPIANQEQRDCSPSSLRKIQTCSAWSSHRWISSACSGKPVNGTAPALSWQPRPGNAWSRTEHPTKPITRRLLPRRVKASGGAASSRQPTRTKQHMGTGWSPMTVFIPKRVANIPSEQHIP